MFCVCCDTPTTNENRLATNIMAVIAYTDTHIHTTINRPHIQLWSPHSNGLEEILSESVRKKLSATSASNNKKSFALFEWFLFVEWICC